jgi:hypothetical protein
VNGTSGPAGPASVRDARYWFVFVTRIYLSASLRLDSLRSLGSALAAERPNCTRGELCSWALIAFCREIRKLGQR